MKIRWAIAKRLKRLMWLAVCVDSVVCQSPLLRLFFSLFETLSRLAYVCEYFILFYFFHHKGVVIMLALTPLDTTYFLCVGLVCVFGGILRKPPD